MVRTNPRTILSPHPLPGPKPGDPPFSMERLATYRDNPGPETERQAVELLERCGPLALDRVLYRLADGQVEAVPLEQLGHERIEAAESYDDTQFQPF
jgi:hypothetical protein